MGKGCIPEPVGRIKWRNNKVMSVFCEQVFGEGPGPCNNRQGLLLLDISRPWQQPPCRVHALMSTLIKT